jgi:ubiquinone/menaquinone biosynthesis C-methylase UbiE
MNDSTNKPLHAKRQFYNQTEVASSYDELRFGGASGAWVNAREIELALTLVPPFHRALDLGCGTGRLTRALAQRGPTVGMDASSAMLTQAQKSTASTLVQGDGFALPFADASFDAVVAVRFFFHFEKVDTLLREAARIVAPRGAVVFDTYLWSPRAWLSLDEARWGGGVFVHPPREIEQAGQRLGLQVVKREYSFLFSPYAYRRLPLAVVRVLARVEAWLPARLRARVFWRFARMD